MVSAADPPPCGTVDYIYSVLPLYKYSYLHIVVGYGLRKLRLTWAELLARWGWL